MLAVIAITAISVIVGGRADARDNGSRSPSTKSIGGGYADALDNILKDIKLPEYEQINRCEEVSKEPALLSDKSRDEWLKNASLLQVQFRKWSVFHNNQRIEITGTKTGTIVEYTKENDGSADNAWKVEIDREEWLDFIRALYDSDIKKWRSRYRNNCVLDGGGWSIEISMDGKTLITSGGRNMNPPGLSDLEDKMKLYRLYSHTSKYRKKFGAPMSEYQLAIREISYSGGFSIKLMEDGRREISYGSGFSIRLMENGMVEYSNSGGGAAWLDAEDWIDVVHTLRNEEPIFKKILSVNRPWNVEMGVSIEKIRMSSAEGITVTTNVSYVRFRDDKLPIFKASEELKGVLDSINAKAENAISE
jgi:hypothetical protein